MKNRNVKMRENLKNSTMSPVESYRRYLKDAEPFFLVLVIAITIFALIIESNFGLEKYFVGVFLLKSLIFLIIFSILIIFIIWSFIRARKEKGNHFIIASFFAVFLLMIALLSIFYKSNPNSFAGLMSTIFWIFLAYLWFELSYLTRIVNIRKKASFYSHFFVNFGLVFINLLAVIYSIKFLNFFQKSFGWSYGAVWEIIIIFLVLIDNFVSMFNYSKGIFKDRGKNLILSLYENNKHKKFLLYRLYNTYKKEWFLIKKSKSLRGKTT